MTILSTTTQRHGGAWQTGLLWRHDNVSLPASKSSALRRLYNLERKLDSNPELSQMYAAKVQEYLDKGYAIKLSSEEAAMEPANTWYLPHFPVVNVNKPGKIRLVFDAAAKSAGTSLNDALLAGPDLLQPLPGVLFRFRQRAVGFSGDIREMFHQVAIQKDDLPAQRFLWRGSNRSEPPEVYCMKAMIFGATSSPVSALYVKNHNAEEFAAQYPEAATAIVRRHYMDDYLDSCHTEQEAAGLVQDVIKVHSLGGFQIRHWESNSMEVLKQVPSDLRASGTVRLGATVQQPTERTLGLHWNPESDVLCFHLSQSTAWRLEGDLTGASKREALSIMMSLFDPLGFLLPFAIRARTLLQTIWRSGVGWDIPLPPKILAPWSEWCRELHEVGQFSVPRCYSLRMANCTGLQLHVLCDASEIAFGAVAYWRIALGGEEDSIDVAFVAARARVAPLKPLSMPRLELQAAVLASRLASSVKEEHEIDPQHTTFWSDSRVVLCWLRSESCKFKPFVSHRVGEILESTGGAACWRWVPTQLNSADDLTRGVPLNSINTTSRWLRGPEFLHHPESEWPAETPVEKPSRDVLEVKAECTLVTTITSSALLPDIKNFSSWLRLIRATAWVLRFVTNIRRRIQGQEARSCELLPTELRKAEQLWWLESQANSYPAEVADLKSGKAVSSSSRLATLSPVLDNDGVLRLDGRIRNAPKGLVCTQPVILDPKHQYTKLLLRQFHIWCGHAGQERMASEVRQRYWVLQLRASVRRTWNDCRECRHNRAQPSIPEMAPLPDCRTEAFVRPFTHTGMDFFGANVCHHPPAKREEIWSLVHMHDNSGSTPRRSSKYGHRQLHTGNTEIL